jgi:hypothetical protein
MCYVIVLMYTFDFRQIFTMKSCRCLQLSVWRVVHHTIRMFLMKKSRVIGIDILSRGLGIMVFNATFNNISVISWWCLSRIYGFLH